MKMEMCDALGRSHEFLLALKRAGMSDDLAQLVINSKDNETAEAMVAAAIKMIGDKAFKLIYEMEFAIPDISESEVLRLAKQSCRENDWFFDDRLANIFGQSSVLTGTKKACIYQAVMAVSEDRVNDFIRRKGYFPGIFGLCASWLEGTLMNGTSKIPESVYIFALEEKPMSLKPAFVKLSKRGDEGSNWNFDLKTFSRDGLISGQAILVIEDIA